MKNGLWYSQQAQTIRLTTHKTECVRMLIAEATYQLWHQRLGHPGQKVLQHFHNCANGVPELQSKLHQFFSCKCCDHAKIKKQNKNVLPSPDKTTSRGQRFHMDFGFVRGDNSHKTNDKTQRIVTSIDGFSSYLIIVDSHTSYTWVFLTSSKEPPIDIVKQLLHYHGLIR